TCALPISRDLPRQLGVTGEGDGREGQRLALRGRLLRRPGRHGGLIIDQLAQLGEVEDVVGHPRNLLHVSHRSVLHRIAPERALNAAFATNPPTVTEATLSGSPATAH